MALRKNFAAAIGFTVKSGWAAVVLLGGPPASPRLLDSRRLNLSDPTIPEARQPYHADFGKARGSGPRLSRLVASVERYGQQSVAGLIGYYRAEGQSLAGIAIIAGSLIDPQRIANAHIRVHALEGRLFRNVVVDAAERNRLACSIWREREIYGRAAEILKKPEPELRAALSALGRPGVRPWRAEQKVAALGAWLVLAGSVRKIKGISRGRTAV